MRFLENPLTARRPLASAWWAVAGLIAVALLVRAPLLARSLWLDEIGQAMAAALPFGAFLEEIRRHAMAAPLDYVGTRLAISIFEDPTVGPRLWPLMCGLLTVPAMYGAGARLFGSRAGILAAAATAVSAFMAFYSAEARPYALIALLVPCHLWATQRRSPVLVATSAALLLTTYVSAVIVGLTLMWMMVERRHLPAVWIGLGSLLALPWWAYALPEQLGERFGYDVPALPIAMAQTLSGLAGPGPLGLIAAVTGIVLAIAAAKRWRHAWWLIGMAGVLLILLWTGAARSGYFWHPRHAIAVLPLGILLAAGGLVALRNKLVVIGAGALLVGSLPWISTLDTGQDWRSLSEWIARNTDGRVTTKYHQITYYAPQLERVAEDASVYVGLEDDGTEPSRGWRSVPFRPFRLYVEP